ncbi:MAG: ethanolamine utilization protein EutH [Neisseriales bacterium]|nr:MAG: ethanolamine utilization protein EutH [Neisseriales bacterium]
MEQVNTIIVQIMMAFMVIAAIDRIFDQFGGIEQVLSKFGLGFIGKLIGGAGKQFEEGFMAMGALGLAMVGVIAIAPILANWLGSFIQPVYEALGANPAMFATTLLAIDMGGFQLAEKLANGDVAAWMYSGVILGAMMGPTIVFSIPVGLGIINQSDRRFLAIGVLAGIVTIPLGCIAGGMVAMQSGVVINGQPVVFTWPLILNNMIPVAIISGLIAIGLKVIPEKMISGFQWFAKFLVGIITIGLVAAVLVDNKIIVVPGLDPIFMIGGDIPGSVLRAIEIIGKIACMLLGAYPMVYLLTRWFKKPLSKIGSLLRMNDAAAAGMVASLANNIPMFGMLSKMDDRGKVLNIAFCVSAAFTFGDHLGFTAAVAAPMIFPMIVGKLVGGVTAVLFAMSIAPKSTVVKVVLPKTTKKVTAKAPKKGTKIKKATVKKAPKAKKTLKKVTKATKA